MEKTKLENALSKTMSPNKIRDSLLDNEFMSDVTFLLGEEQTQLKAHKIFLMTSSPILHKLLTDNKEEHLNVKIQQITKPIMMEICRYAYTDELKLTKDNMLDMLFAASKFEMRFLVEKTIDFICKHLSDETVFKCLESNQKHNNLRISMKCFEYIEKNHQKCFKNDDFLKLSNEMFRTIISTCKIPKDSAKQAVRAWTKENNFDDLDELMSLVSLKAESDTKDNNNNSKGASANAKPPSAKTERQKSEQPNSRARSRPRKPENTSLSTFNLCLPSTFPVMQHAGVKTFGMVGNITRKNFKYANLDIVTPSQMIFLKAVQFLYDLRTTDKEFEISVVQVNGNQRVTMYSDKVVMNTGNSRSFNTYEFTRKVAVPAGQKIWIRIEFPRPEFRLTFDNFDFWPPSMGNDIQLRKEDMLNSYAEIIQSILYTLS